MLFLLGLMGIVAVGATALVWYEVSSRSAEAEDDAASVAETSKPAEPKSESTEAGSDTVDHIDELLATAADLATTPQDDVADSALPQDKTPDNTGTAKPESEHAVIPEPVLDMSENATTTSEPVTALETNAPRAARSDAERQVEPACDEFPQEQAPETASQADDVFHAAHQDNVREFRPEEDRLIVVYDDQADAFPVVGLEFESADSERAFVSLNGQLIATVEDAAGLTLDHITLVPESSLGGPLAA